MTEDIITNQMIYDRLETIDRKLNAPTLGSDWISIDEVAKMLKISRQTVYIYTRDGDLKSYRLAGRVFYKLSEINSAIQEIRKGSAWPEIPNEKEKLLIARMTLWVVAAINSYFKAKNPVSLY